VLEVSVPIVLINGMQASADQLARPVNDGHFTAMQVRSGRARGLAHHLVRLCSTHAELYGTELDADYLRAMMQRAVEHHSDASLRVNLYESQPGLPQVITAIRTPVEAEERAQLLLPVDYSRPFAPIKHVALLPKSGTAYKPTRSARPGAAVGSDQLHSFRHDTPGPTR
jgi:hypothetical protein